MDNFVRSFLLMFVLFLLTLPSYAQSLEDTQEVLVADRPVVDIDWKEYVVGKRVQEKDGSRYVTFHNGKTYIFVKNLLIEEVDDERIVLQKNIYDFDNSILIHEFRKGKDESNSCPSLVTSFQNISPTALEEKISLSCFIVGDWFSLVHRGDTRNIFYHNYCDGRYDDKKL
ncbi:MAG: hypothetical protein KDI11_02400 [Alphaproteobacteria bacterium]|nr:hypothetical protein [Alphaproteobacteria bacterium]